MSAKYSRKNDGNENTAYTEIKYPANNKTRSSLCLMSTFLAVLFFITTVVFVILFLWFYIKHNQRAQYVSDKGICKTSDCFHSASKIAEKMNFSADPCMDFNEFACGRYQSEVQIPPARTMMDSFSGLADANMLVMRDIVSEDIKQGEPLYLTNMKRLYKSCMDEAKIEDIGTKPFLADYLASDWPTLNTHWDASSFNLGDLIERYVKVTITPLYGIFVSEDSMNSSRNVIFLRQPSLFLSREYLIRPRNDSVIKAYEKFLADTAVDLGALREVADADAKDVMDLEISLAKITVPREEARDERKIYNPFTLKELSEMFPEMHFPLALRTLFGDVNIHLSDDEKIILAHPTYIVNISEVLGLFSHRVIHNLFGFKNAVQRVCSLTKRMREIRLELQKVLNGVSAEGSRWETCVDISSTKFSLGMGKYFVARTFTETSKDYMESMVDNLKKSFKQMIEESSWMGQATKLEAYKKLDKMKHKIGYPNANFQDADIEAMYLDYTMSEDNYYGNIQLARRLDNIRDLLKLRNSEDKSMFYMDLFTVNAYYSWSANEIAFPAGILQPPYFSPTSQDSLNYAAIGTTIGHEITHGYDDAGAQYDADGNLRNWWAESDLNNFRQRTQCIIDQYSGFYVKDVDMRLNGVSSQGENVADNGGLKESFRAYKELTLSKGEQPTLPGLELTQDQLFFLAFSQIWCEKMRREALIKQVTSQPHLPGKYRIIGPLQNSEDFAKAYNCPRGSYMNPEKKCSVW